MYRWELDGLAQQEFAELPPAARAALVAFMDAVVIVDPVQYQRRRDERDDVSVGGDLLLSRTIQLPPVHASDAEPGPDLLPAHPLFRRRRTLISVGFDAS